MFELTELQKDAITEIFNIGVGQAGDSLSRMVREPVRLSVPDIRVSRRADALTCFQYSVALRVCAVIQRFSGPFVTDAMLMFPEERSLELIRLFVGEDLPLDEMTDMEQEAMAEIGNIILNACIGAMASLFQAEFRGGLPHVRLGEMADILEINNLDARPDLDGDDALLLLFIEFALQQREIKGYLAFVLDLPSSNQLRHRVDQFLAGAVGSV